MPVETSKGESVSLSAEQMKSKIQSALNGGNETFILPKSEWSNFADAASTVLEPMAQDMHLKQNNAIKTVMEKMGLETGNYLNAAKDIIGSLRPDVLSAMNKSDTLEIKIREHSGPSDLDLNISCDFIDQNSSSLAHSIVHISFLTQEDGSIQEAHSFSLRNPADSHWTYFSISGHDGLL